MNYYQQNEVKEDTIRIRHAWIVEWADQLTPGYMAQIDRPAVAIFEILGEGKIEVRYRRRACGLGAGGSRHTMYVCGRLRNQLDATSC